MINLIGNAVKFTPRGEVIARVSLVPASSPSLQQVLVEVVDTGIGIASEVQATIFSSFAQADASTTRVYGGTGLGLAISHQLVQLMGGEIGVESLEGSGSRFWFTICFDPGDVGDVTEQATADDAATIAPSPVAAAEVALDILVVDDNSTNRGVAVAMLQKHGHRVDVAVNGEDALEAVSRKRYAAVLMDCQMPVMDGYEAARAIRALDGRHRETPIIAMTASARVSDRDRCFAAGMDDYISKPIRLRELLAVVERATTSELGPHGVDPVSSGSAPTLDAALVHELQELDGGGDMSQLVESFLGHATAGLEELRAAIETADIALVARTCHRLQGSSANVGAAGMAEVLAELEVAALDDALVGAPEILRRVEAEFARVAPELTAAFPTAAT